MTDPDREAFEAKHLGGNKKLAYRNTTTGHYVLASIQDAWDGYQVGLAHARAQPMPPMPWHEILLSKFPVFDPSWSDEVKAKWFENFDALKDAKAQPPALHEHERGAPLTADCDNWCRSKHDAFTRSLEQTLDSARAQPQGERVLMWRSSDGGLWSEASTYEREPANRHADLEYAWATIERIP